MVPEPVTERPLTYRLVTIFREEGPAALYKGFAPKVLRLAPGGGVLLLVVEVTLGIFRKGASSFSFAIIAMLALTIDIL